MRTAELTYLKEGCPDILVIVIGLITDNDLRLGYAAVRLGPETGTRHRPHAEVKMAAVPEP